VSKTAKGADEFLQDLEEGGNGNYDPALLYNQVRVVVE
jgi:hypothetical protein